MRSRRKNFRSNSIVVPEISRIIQYVNYEIFVQILMLLGRMTSKLSGNHVSNVLSRLKVVGHDLGSSIKYFSAKTTCKL